MISDHYSLTRGQVNTLQTFSVQQMGMLCNSFTVWFSTMQLHWVCY